MLQETLPRALPTLGLLALCSTAVAAQEPALDAEPVVHMGRAFMFEADLEAARVDGWIDPAVGDTEALERTRVLLKERLRMAGRFVEAQVHLEEDGRLAIVFVGFQDPRIEEFLIQGISSPGRLASGLVARDEDLEVGSVAQERARLDAWRGANPERAIRYFNALAVSDGGPSPALQWLEPRSGAGAAVPVLRAPRLTISRREAEQLYADPNENSGRGESTFSLLLKLKPDFGQELFDFHRSHADRERVLLLDDRVMVTEPIAPLVTDAVPEKPTLHVPGEFSMVDVRATVFSVMGEPLPVRLRFQGFEKRPLVHVKQRES